MGNSLAGRSSSSQRSRRGSEPRTSKVLFLLHRTWAIIVTDKWTRTRLSRPTTTGSMSDTSDDYDSQYSFCSCSQCHRDDGFSSDGFSDIFGSGSSMAPNSEERVRIGSFPWDEENLNKEKQRPPVYNPEDYSNGLRKWTKKSPNGTTNLYSIQNNDTECPARSPSHSFRDYRNPMLTSGGEMTLRQFGTVSELLSKLRADMKLAYPSFVQEFVADPLDGVTLLLELLRIIQLSQSNNANGATGSIGATGRIPPSIQRRALLDELVCLQCLQSCCGRYSEAVRKMTSSSAGLFTLAVCIMSNVNKSRIIALQLLTKACDSAGNGHSSVSEAMSTLRLRFGEPVRFRFLIGMLTSAGGQGELLAGGIRFLNRFLDTSGSPQKRLYIQAELEQAGFDVIVFKKIVSISSPAAEMVFEELDHWEKNHIDVENLSVRVEDAEKENDSLKDKVLLLERRIQILQEEKGILISLEQCLKERCSELQDEVISLKSGHSPKTSNRSSQKRNNSTPAEDEGISSSERSMTPEEDLQREAAVYEIYSVQSETLQMKSASKHSDSQKCDDEEETTIEEVIEELKNIINEAETEVYANETKKEERSKINKIQMRVDSNVLIRNPVFDEGEIIPSNLHPQPPRKTRSLVHLYISNEECPNKEIFFENETHYTTDEDSDSLLSASKCQLPRVDKEIPLSNNNTNRAILDSIMDARERAILQEKRRRKIVETCKRSESFQHVIPDVQTGSTNYQRKTHKPARDSTRAKSKSKSLDRIDDGIDSMVDVVVTNSPHLKPREGGNITGTTLARSISNVFSNKKDIRTRHDDKYKIFLPIQPYNNRDQETHYYFPRVQEKSGNGSFMVRRGHTNAGLYSGRVNTRDNYCSSNKLGDFNVNSKNHINSVMGKVTDIPSGLY